MHRIALVALLLVAPLAAGKTITAQLHDNPLHLAPERMEANVNETLVIHVQNRGAASHDFFVCSLPEDGGCGKPLAFTPLLATGKSANITFTPTKEGAYEYYCKVTGHKEGGMRGTLLVGQQGTQESPFAVVAMMLALLGAALVARRT